LLRRAMYSAGVPLLGSVSNIFQGLHPI